MKKNNQHITEGYALHDARAGVRYPQRKSEIIAACDRWLASRGIRTTALHPFKANYGKKTAAK